MEKIETQSNITLAQSMNDLSTEQTRAIQQVQGQLILAKKFPRDEVSANTSIINACRRYTLADVAAYKFPRGKKTVTGPSIRMAEMLAQYWENMEYGWEEIERQKGVSKCMAFCWDMQRNLRKVVKFDVEHQYKADGVMKKLIDPRDIYEYCANQASRRMRACILALIPADIIESAMNECKKTLAKGDGTQSLEERIRNTVLRFNDIGVTQEMIEKYLDHEIAVTTGEEIADLIPIYRVIADGQKKRTDFFLLAPEDKPASKLSEALKTIDEKKND